MVICIIKYHDKTFLHIVKSLCRYQSFLLLLALEEISNQYSKGYSNMLDILTKL